MRLWVSSLIYDRVDVSSLIYDGDDAATVINTISNKDKSCSELLRKELGELIFLF